MVKMKSSQKEVNNMTIKFNDFGKSLGTREMGSKIRDKITNCINRGENVVFDFTGVEILSHSYADEVFGKLLKEFGIKKIKETTNFQNANEYVTKIIVSVINESVQLK